MSNYIIVHLLIKKFIKSAALSHWKVVYMYNASLIVRGFSLAICRNRDSINSHLITSARNERM